MEYILHVIIMLNIYILLVLSANLPIGMANLLTMCQAAFYGIGAYISTFFLMQFELPFIVVTYTVLYNWTDVTRGPYGIPGIPGIKLLGLWDISGNIWAYFIVTTIISFVIICLFRKLKDSPYGRILKAIRDDELSVKAVGRDTAQIKSWAFFLSASLTGLAGLIYASYVSYIDPTSFTLDESIFIVSALFIGGTGNVKGPVTGALFVILLPEILRFIGMPDTVAANMRQIIYGLALVLVMYFRPQGISGENIVR